MRTIHKFPLEPVSEQLIPANDNFKPLFVGHDPNGKVCLWAEVDTLDLAETAYMFKLYMVGTGHQLEPKHLCYLNSINDGIFVWHFYY